MPFNLSKARKLKGVRFECTGLNVRWIAATLRTAKSTNFRNITIMVTSCVAPPNSVEEMVHREWQDLDHLLVQLWTSRLIRPKITYMERRVAKGLGKLVLSLLPNLAGKGVVSGVGKYRRRPEW